jgi:hypothetical protein
MRINWVNSNLIDYNTNPNKSFHISARWQQSEKLLENKKLRRYNLLLSPDNKPTRRVLMSTQQIEGALDAIRRGFIWVAKHPGEALVCFLAATHLSPQLPCAAVGVASPLAGVGCLLATLPEPAAAGLSGKTFARAAGAAFKDLIDKVLPDDKRDPIKKSPGSEVYCVGVLGPYHPSCAPYYQDREARVAIQRAVTNYEKHLGEQSHGQLLEGLEELQKNIELHSRNLMHRKGNFNFLSLKELNLKLPPVVKLFFGLGRVVQAGSETGHDYQAIRKFRDSLRSEAEQRVVQLADDYYVRLVSETRDPREAKQEAMIQLLNEGKRYQEVVAECTKASDAKSDVFAPIGKMIGAGAEFAAVVAEAVVLGRGTAVTSVPAAALLAKQANDAVADWKTASSEMTQAQKERLQSIETCTATTMQAVRADQQSQWLREARVEARERGSDSGGTVYEGVDDLRLGDRHKDRSDPREMGKAETAYV